MYYYYTLATTFLSLGFQGNNYGICQHTGAFTYQVGQLSPSNNLHQKTFPQFLQSLDLKSIQVQNGHDSPGEDGGSTVALVSLS